MELFLDTETSGLPLWREPYNHPGQPWVVQLAAILSDSERVYGSLNVLIAPLGRRIEPGTVEIHGITEEMARDFGIPEQVACRTLYQLMRSADVAVCHNTEFDIARVACMFDRNDGDNRNVAALMLSKPSYCTMKSSMNLLQLPGQRKWCKDCRIEHEPGPKCPQCGTVYEYKWPKLTELYSFLFGKELVDAHDAWGDVVATRECYYEMKRREDEPCD